MVPKIFFVKEHHIILIKYNQLISKITTLAQSVSRAKTVANLGATYEWGVQW